MPSIKLKKKTQEYLAEKEREKEAKAQEAAAQSTPLTPPSPKKAKHSPTKEKSLPKYLDSEILFEKRKRTIPVIEQKCQDWIMDNFETKEDVHVSTTKMYQYYTESMLENVGVVADVTLFNRIIREKLGKGFGLKESSPLNGVIKELKTKAKKPKVQGETLSLKIKDILNEVITAAGNPNKGIRFHNLKQLVGSKYPALQVETHPKKLLSALDRGIRYSQIILVKGSGKCGYYRVPGESTAEEDKPKPKVKKSKGEVEDEEETPKEGEEEETEEKPKETKQKRGKKRKSDGVQESAGDNEKPEETAETNGEAPEKKKKKSKSKKNKKNKKRDAFRGEAARHGDPQKIEDVFPLALTYMSEPKEASVQKIRNYIHQFYPSVDTDSKLKIALLKGEDKGMWQCLRGSTYRLLLEDFQPGYSDTLEDMITQAIMACHEPKVASAIYLKKYVLQYHEDFKVDARPHLFNKALERAISKNIIRRMSGLGASGSFQLVKVFTPSPAILAGEIDEDIMPDDDDDDEIGEVYIVRRTKSGRGSGRGLTVKERKPPAVRH